ncbi:hypothetical protein SDC9_166129 [bioreactor metagenome]|uniref:Uncharacterized protein n=1 Tax=bioreactor metagenome TaxID=1076179 RepID=A0A645FY03_9ZZZZ
MNFPALAGVYDKLQLPSAPVTRLWDFPPITTFIGALAIVFPFSSIKTPLMVVDFPEVALEIIIVDLVLALATLKSVVFVKASYLLFSFKSTVTVIVPGLLGV